MVCRSPVLNFIFAECQPVSLEFLKAFVAVLLAVLLGKILPVSYHFS
jgi:hypothetical protein